MNFLVRIYVESFFFIRIEFQIFFFRVSSLAYPNLLGKKGYVIVVVGKKGYVIVVVV